MTRTAAVLAFMLAGSFSAYPQDWRNPPYDSEALFPQEVRAGEYQQVSPDRIQALAAAGWELVSVTPYVYRNEERGTAATNRPLVTQVYPAFHFKRMRRYGNLYPSYEVTSLFPQETSPGSYRQVDQREIQTLAAQGWELVATVPFAMKNEERGREVTNRPLVTQTYPAYFLRRLKN